MSEMIVTSVIAAGLIGLIVWWFFGKRSTSVVKAELENGRQTVEITVDGGYQPNVVEVKSGVPTDIIFQRKDKSSCFDEVILPDFGEKSHLEVGKPHTFRVNPDKPGEYTYSCGMHMFFGKIVVK